jgi:hypothetical protein
MDTEVSVKRHTCRTVHRDGGDLDVMAQSRQGGRQVADVLFLAAGHRGIKLGHHQHSHGWNVTYVALSHRSAAVTWPTGGNINGVTTKPRVWCGAPMSSKWRAVNDGRRRRRLDPGCRRADSRAAVKRHFNDRSSIVILLNGFELAVVTSVHFCGRCNEGKFERTLGTSG